MLNFHYFSSVAIVGASEDSKKIGHILLAKNQDFSGKIYGINTKGGSFAGNDFYTNFADLSEVPDVAVFAIPEPFVYDSLREAGEKGVKNAVIITAGFKEVGNAEGEKKLIEIGKQYGIRILGPNCLGYADTVNNLNIAFGSKFFVPGNIGIISQSGAMAVAITDVLAERRLGFSRMYTMGNKSDIDETDMLEALSDDEHTEVIAVYLESVNRGEQFIKTLKKVTQKKPVIVMFGGVSESGKVASASHTGSLSGGKILYEAAIRQANAHLTYSLDTYFAAIENFSRTASAKLAGEAIIITNAGGPGVLATDQAEFFRVPLAHISENHGEILRQNMPNTMSTKNPIDIIGDADSMRVSHILANIEQANISADILAIFTVQATTDIDAIATKIADFHTENPYRFLSVALIGGETVANAANILREKNIAVLATTESLIETYAMRISGMKNPQKSEKNAQKSTSHSEAVLLGQNETEEILKKYHIPTTETLEADNLDEILAYVRKNSGPFVMKIAGENIAHKTDIGGVLLGLSTEEDITRGYYELQEKFVSHVPDEKFLVTVARFVKASPKAEIFFGATRDESFGDVFIVGTGGVTVNILEDTITHIGVPSADEVKNILSSLRLSPLLFGYRNTQKVDIDALAEMIVKLATLFSAEKHIREIDINPILFDDGKGLVADAKLYLY